MKSRVSIVAPLLVACAVSAYAATLTSGATTTTTSVTTSAVALPAPTATATPVAQPTPVALAGTTTTTTTASAPVALAKLPPLDLSDMRLWNYAGKWHASEWASALSFTPWKFARVAKAANGDVRFTLNSTGAPELKAGTGIVAVKDGLWETEVTLPTMRSGLVIAPLWLYNNSTRDEIDFEFAGRKGLDVTVHKYVNGLHLSKTVRLFAGVDMSGQRKRFGIEVSQARGTIRMFVDGVLVHTFDRQTLGFFPTSEFRPLISMWPARSDWSNFVQWVGKWTPLKTNQQIVLVAHGYGYTAP